VKLTIFGATGGVGRLLVEQALAEGHEVTAVARNPRGLPEGVRVVTADLASPDSTAVAGAVKGADAVLSCLGARAPTDVGVAARGTQAIVQAMADTGVRRVVVVSAAPVATVPSPGRPHPPRHDPGDGFFTRTLAAPILKRIFRKPYADLAAMEDVLREGGLDWTVIRPPRLVDKPVTGLYRTMVGKNLRGGLSIARADVAHLMLRVPGQAETIRQTVAIAY
jgi:uncharacterized protein YbjT (DUF2867 family)